MKHKIDAILEKLTVSVEKCPKCNASGKWQTNEEIKTGFVSCFNCEFTFPVQNAIKWQ